MSLWRDPTRRRWLAWFTLAAAFVLVNFHRVSTGVLADDLTQVFDTSAAELGLLHASFFYIYAPMQLVAGMLADQTGTRRVATIGSLVMAIGVFGFAMSDTYLAGFASRALIGVGASVIYIATLRFCANWFETGEFATVAGMTLSASAVGGIIATTPLALFVAEYGWRSAFLTVGAVGLVGTLAIYVAVRDDPADAGMDPIEGAADPPDITPRETIQNAKLVLSERETWVLGGMLFFVIGTNFTVMGLWGIPYLVQAYGLSVSEASVFTLLGNTGLVVGSPVMGWLSDWLGRRTELIVVAAVVYTLAYGVIAALGTPPLVVVGAAFFIMMFLLGGFTLAYTVVRERFDGAVSGTATGAVNALGFFGGAVFPAILGAALDAFWTGELVAGSRVYSLFGYRVAFGIATLNGLIALGCAVWLHQRESTEPEKSEAVAAGSQ
ncbi:MFS transporter [Haloarchaeobius sp. HME9146]|uniref:MFS transporter n=1 Tax=Haloarchaeobius sp. HME9146 TaxID=2978732 RepID=UPI0021BFB0F9|nr:MFS transporter [Haloarchaeobius sp. HME9146]MCT9096742.1 MFS transporter [Haloarchaeobius sp. HME9146]